MRPYHVSIQLMFSNNHIDLSVSKVDRSSDFFVRVGAAVVAFQLFESAFVLAAKFAMKQDEAENLEEVVPIDKEKAFKQVAGSVLKEICALGKIDSELESRPTTLIENRHRIVHRLIHESNGQFNDRKWRLEVVKYCREVTTECNELTRTLVEMTTDWMQRFPKAREGLRRRQEETFRIKQERMLEQLKNFEDSFDVSFWS